MVLKTLDSRLKPQDRTRKQVVGPRGLQLDRVFCASCGKDAGLSFTDTTSIVYVCQLCYETHGGLPLPVIADDEIENFLNDDSKV